MVETLYHVYLLDYRMNLITGHVFFHCKTPWLGKKNIIYIKALNFGSP